MSLHLPGRLAPLAVIFVCTCLLETLATGAGEPSSGGDPSDTDLKAAIRHYYNKHWVKPLRTLGTGETVEMRITQQIKRYEVRNTYTRTIEGEQFRFYDLAVETKSGAGIVTELIPLRFVKRGNSWYSSLDAEREVQQLAAESLSPKAKLYDHAVPKEKLSEGQSPTPIVDYIEEVVFAFANAPDDQIARVIKGESTGAKVQLILSPQKTHPRLNVKVQGVEIGFEIEGEVGKDFAVAGTPFYVHLDNYWPDFRVLDGKPTSVSNQPNNPAAGVTIRGRRAGR